MGKKELYIQGIQLLTDYFARHGIEINVGMELEFLAPRPADETGNKFFGEIPPKKKELDAERENDPVAASKRKPSHLIPENILNEYKVELKKSIAEITHPKGGVIDFKAEVPVDKYEVIMCPLSPLKAIEATERVKSILIEDKLPQMQAQSWAEKISFGSYQGRVMPALHTNISMVYKGKSVFKDEFGLSDLGIALAHGMKNSLHETTMLVAPFPSSYARYASDAHPSYPKDIAVNEEHWNKDGKCIGLKFREVPSNHCMYPPDGVESFENSYWIENRLPSGDCQPYVAVFTTMLALYDSFRKVVTFDAAGNLLEDQGSPKLSNDAHAKRKDYKISTDLQSARHDFAHGKTLKERMNELDPEQELGDKIHEMETRNQIKIRHKTKSLPLEARPDLGALRR